MKEKRGMISGGYILKYTLMMGILFAVTFLWFIYYGKSFVWEQDGFCQHYTALVYYGDYLRGIVRNLFVNHRLELPLWDMDIGYGSDILITLHYYVVGDPLNLLAVFVPDSGMEYLYEGLILFRIYLAGLSFSCFAFSRNHWQLFYRRRGINMGEPEEAGAFVVNYSGEGEVLVGSACYCFCGYVLNIAVRHPYFINPMIYLPMLLLGVDRIYQKNKPILYIVSVALAGISNFYFFYILGLLVILYAAARYLEMLCRNRAIQSSEGSFHEKGVYQINWRELLKWVGCFTAYSLLGIAMAAVVLLPVVIGMYGTDRVGVDFHIPLWYTDSYYKELFLQFTGGGRASHYSYLGYSALGFLALVTLYFRKGENTLIKILFPVMTLFLSVPYIGHVFNGFSYRTNRFIFAYSLLVASILVRAVPIFFTLRTREKMKLIVITLLYGVACLSLSSGPEVVTEMMLLTVCCGVICGIGKVSGKWRFGILLVLFGVCTFFQGFYLYTPVGEDYQKEFVETGQCLHKLLQQASEAALCDVMGEDSACRFDRTRKVSTAGEGVPQNNNEAMAINRHGIGYYFSLDNPGISEFLREMQLNTTSYHRYSDMDSRNILETLSSVKYVVAKKGQTGEIPRQYQENEICHQKGFAIYQAKEALPIGYTYQSYIPKTLYDTLSVVEKQQTLLQSCVLENSSFPAELPDFCHCLVSCDIKAGKGISLKHNRIKVKRKNAHVTIHCEKTVPGELYVIFSGLKYQYGEKNQARLRFLAGGKEGVLNLKNNRNNFYAGIEDFLVNLGDFEEPVTKITLTFEGKGNYSYEALSIVSQPMEKQLAYAHQRGQQVLENITFPTNQIRGDISLSEDRILFLSVPYSTGWRAWVDGKKAELKQANTFGMALELIKGKHQITLAYRTPYLLPGAVVSVLGCICFFCFLLYNVKRR